jgi:hypothetical protein
VIRCFDENTAALDLDRGCLETGLGSCEDLFMADVDDSGEVRAG